MTPYIISLLVNFLIIGFFAWLVLKSFGKDWPLGLHKFGLAEGLKKYAFAGVTAGIFSCVAFIIGLTPFDYEPSVWKILIEGVLYYFGVAIIEELYVRGLFLNIVDRFAHKKEHHVVIAIWVSSIVFGLGHIPGLIGMEPLVILFKVISTIGMGLYFGAIYKRTNNLWVPIILHGFIDICALPYRVPAAVNAYNEGRSPKIMMCGGPTRNKGGEDIVEAERMRMKALELGVPDEVISLKQRGSG